MNTTCVTKNQVRIAFGMIAFVFSIVGCTTFAPIPDNPAEQSLVVGYVDFEDSPAVIYTVILKQLYPPVPDGSPFLYFSVEDGVFAATLSPGDYRVVKFSGKGKIPLLTSGTRYEFSFSAQGKGALDPTVKESGAVNFLGSFKYVEGETTFLAGSKFDIQPTETPSQKEVLIKLLPQIEKTPWVEIVQKRIDELK